MSETSEAKTVYRMAVDASVCFSVPAESEEEAIETARQLLSDWVEGLDVVADDEYECRVYLDDSGESLSVEDIEELEHDDA